MIMQKRCISLFLILAGVCFFPPSYAADVSVAKEVEAQKVFFDSSAYELSNDMRLILDQAVSLLSRMNESYSLKLMGFTDSHGSEELNQTLSVQRANVVASYLISQGIDRNRILIQGLGREQPIASNDTEEGRSENRRVEFKFISPDTSDLKLTASMAPVVTEQKIDEPEEAPAEPAKPSLPDENLQQTMEVIPEPEPAAQSEVKTNTQPTVAVPEKVETHPVLNQPVEDTMIAPQKKHGPRYFKNHVYEDRKRSDQGQAYAQVMPLWFTADHAGAIGASEDRIQSQPSFGGELGWSSFFEESYETFFSARIYGSVLRFSSNAATTVDKQKEYTYGGELGLGRYFHPNIYFQVQSGYSSELFYQSTASGIDLDTDYIWHAGLSTEWVVWRFSQKGDVGFNGYFNYYDFGHEELDFGSGYGVDLFVDYDFLRAGFNFSFLNLETTSFQFNTWQYGPTIRLYF